MKYLAEALDYYSNAGYTYVEVPWAVSREASEHTAPAGVDLVETPWGYLVGSAEQGFIQNMIDNKQPDGKFVSWSPCFRVEKSYDYLTRPYFTKVELIHVNPQDPHLALASMLGEALTFFAFKMEVRLEITPEGYDIMAGDIELGSYGIRKYQDCLWVYGTGLAEPRFSIALEVD